MCVPLTAPGPTVPYTSVADASFQLSVPPATGAAAVPAPPAPSVVPAGGGGAAGRVDPRPQAPLPPEHVAPWNLPRAPRGPRPDGLDRDTGRLIAASFGIAFVLAPAVEPMPAEPMPDFPLWQLPIELAALAAIVAAVVVLWRGGRNGARLGAAAGVLMAALTIICPLAGHSTVGWWTWVQTGLSLVVLGTSAALMARMSRQAAQAPGAPH